MIEGLEKKIVLFVTNIFPRVASQTGFISVALQCKDNISFNNISSISSPPCVKERLRVSDVLLREVLEPVIFGVLLLVLL